MKTLIANINHAARNRETLTIGGGQFRAEELLLLVEAAQILADARRAFLRGDIDDVEGILTGDYCTEILEGHP